jgi:hypothetical protein
VRWVGGSWVSLFPCFQPTIGLHARDRTRLPASALADPFRKTDWGASVESLLAGIKSRRGGGDVYVADRFVLLLPTAAVSASYALACWKTGSIGNCTERAVESTKTVTYSSPGLGPSSCCGGAWNSTVASFTGRRACRVACTLKSCALDSNSLRTCQDSYALRNKRDYAHV